MARTHAIVVCIREIEGRGVEMELVKWVRSMLCERTVKATLAGETVSKTITSRGTPEGGKLSPELGKRNEYC